MLSTPMTRITTGCMIVPTSALFEVGLAWGVVLAVVMLAGDVLIEDEWLTAEFVTTEDVLGTGADVLGTAEDVLETAEDVLGAVEDVFADVSVPGIALSESEIPICPHGCMPNAPSEEAAVKLAFED